MFKTQSRWISFSGRTLATVALMATGGFLLHAQTAGGGEAASVQDVSTQGVSAQEPIFHLQTTADGQVDSSGQGYSSSTSSSGLSESDVPTTQVALNAEPPFHFFNAQYGGGRQRYGRPKYRGSNTNADGSPKWDFFVGGGLGIPVGSQFNYATPSWAFGGGGGRMFNAHFGTNIEFNYDHFGMTGSALTDQQNLYNYYINLYNLQNPRNPVQPIAGLDGNSHIWSFSLQPIYNLKTGEGIGAYVTGGGGYYHKVANFTVPAIGTYCDPFYGCYQYTANQVIDHYTSNAFGVNGGLGITYKFSRFSGQRLFAEVRYVHLFNSYRPGVTINTPPSPANASVYNDFPQNSQHTDYLPVKFGLRF
jgi:hypothetical protein